MCNSILMDSFTMTFDVLDHTAKKHTTKTEVFFL